MANAQAHEDARESTLLRRLDRREQVLGRLLRHALER
jgi:hypothetical protein